MTSQMPLLANSHIVLAALDEGDTAIIVLRPDPTGTFRVIDNNTTFNQITNYTRDEALGISLSRLRGQTTDLAMQLRIDEAMRSGKGMRGEIEFVSRTGRAFWFGFTVMPIIDPVEGHLQCVLLGRDITEKRKQDREQSAIQTMLAQVFQKIDAPVVVAQSDGHFVLANPAWQTLLGYDAREVPSLTARQITASAYKDIVSSAHSRQFEDGAPYHLDIAVVRKNGTQIPVHLTSVIGQHADMKWFRIVTLRPLGSAAPVDRDWIRSLTILD